MHPFSTGSPSGAGQAAKLPAGLGAIPHLALALTLALVQQLPAHASPADPMEAKATLPALRYQSAFEGYRPNLAQAPASWKDANDTAARKGGWRAYAREANAPEPEAAKPTAMPPAHRHGGKP